MNLRERLNHPQAMPTAPDAGGDGGHLENLRREGNDFLAAGDEAIRKAMSGDSARFLESNRQQGGQ
jgi:hypothetical protein